MKNLIGDKYYKFVDNKVKIFRITKLNKSTCFLTSESDGTRFKIPFEILDKEFTKLESHGVIFFNILDVAGNETDVSATLFRKKDLTKMDNKPYAICRQKINNLFKHQYDNVVFKRDDRIHLGMSISQDTCSNDIPFESLLACNGIQFNECISIYIDDTLDSILSLINTTPFDVKLQYYYDTITKDPKFNGLSKSLRELLTENEFMYDFESAFNIKRVDFVIEYDEETFELDHLQRNELERELNVEMFKTYVTKYDYTIALSKIEREYVLVIDKNNDIHIVAYDRGDYINSDFKSIIRQKQARGFK